MSEADGTDTVTVLVENTYTCGRESSSVHQVALPPLDQDLDEWWNDSVHELTGDGHPCGASEHALYTATITSEPCYSDGLLGASFEWEG